MVGCLTTAGFQFGCVDRPDAVGARSVALVAALQFQWPAAAPAAAPAAGASLQPCHAPAKQPYMCQRVA